jgi:hypothetical protein
MIANTPDRVLSTPSTPRRTCCTYLQALAQRLAGQMVGASCQQRGRRRGGRFCSHAAAATAAAPSGHPAWSPPSPHVASVDAVGSVGVGLREEWRAQLHALPCSGTAAAAAATTFNHPRFPVGTSSKYSSPIQPIRTPQPGNSACVCGGSWWDVRSSGEVAYSRQRGTVPVADDGARTMQGSLTRLASSERMAAHPPRASCRAAAAYSAAAAAASASVTSSVCGCCPIAVAVERGSALEEELAPSASPARG